MGEVPVGAVITRGEEILSTAHNCPITMKDPSAHAESWLSAGGRKNGQLPARWNHLYVTLEPCIMCAAAILQARISRVVFGADDPKNGGLSHLPTLRRRETEP